MLTLRCPSESPAAKSALPQPSEAIPKIVLSVDAEIAVILTTIPSIVAVPFGFDGRRRVRHVEVGGDDARTDEPTGGVERGEQ